MSLAKVTNYGDLWSIHLDIQEKKRTSPAFYHFNQHKIKEFYAEYGKRVELVAKSMRNLIQEYVQHDDKLQPMSQDGLWIFPTQEMADTYSKQYTKLMQTTLMLTV